MDSDTLGDIASALATIAPIVLWGGVVGAGVAWLLHHRRLALALLVFALIVMVAQLAVGIPTPDPGDGGWRGRSHLDVRGDRSAARLAAPATHPQVGGEGLDEGMIWGASCLGSVCPPEGGRPIV